MTLAILSDVLHPLVALRVQHLYPYVMIQKMVIFLLFANFNDFFLPFFLGPRASYPAILKSFTHFVMSGGLFIPTDNASS